MKPVIGIVEWPYHDKDDDAIYEVLTPLIDWVNKCGGRPIGIFPSQVGGFLYKKNSEIREMTFEEKIGLLEAMELCSAIIKPGATKVYPHERYIYELCAKNNMPYLGICAGMQLMAYRGKKDMNNIRNDSKIEHHSSETYCHKVHLEDRTLLKRILNKDEIMVNSKHNYHISNAGKNVISAYSVDGYIEAIESKVKSFQIGVQWHPELLPLDDENSEIIFGELVEAAKVYKKKTWNKLKY